MPTDNAAREFCSTLNRADRQASSTWHETLEKMLGLLRRLPLARDRVGLSRRMNAATVRPPTAWRRFKLWAGFPEYEDLPRCGGCGERVTVGEYPVYPWVCRNPTTKECWR